MNAKKSISEVKTQEMIDRDPFLKAMSKRKRFSLLSNDGRSGLFGKKKF